MTLLQCGSSPRIHKSVIKSLMDNSNMNSHSPISWLINVIYQGNERKIEAYCIHLKTGACFGNINWASTGNIHPLSKHTSVKHKQCETPLWGICCKSVTKNNNLLEASAAVEKIGYGVRWSDAFLKALVWIWRCEREFRPARRGVNTFGCRLQAPSSLWAAGRMPRTSIYLPFYCTSVSLGWSVSLRLWAVSRSP